MGASSPQFFRILLQRNLEDRRLVKHTEPATFSSYKANLKISKLIFMSRFAFSSSSLDRNKEVEHHSEEVCDRPWRIFVNLRTSLKLPNGMEWKVGVTTAPNGVVWLQKGWHKFAEHYSLEFGSLVVFKLEGSSTFHTTIFDPTGVETEYCCNFNHFRRAFEDLDSDSDPHEIIESFPRRSKKREKPSVPACRQSQGCEPSSKKRISRDPVRVSRRRQRFANKAEAAQRFRSKSEKPGFKVVMKQPNVDGRFEMIIPKNFAEKYLSEEDVVVVKLQTANGKTWPLLYKWSRNRGNFAYISSGWKRFIEENLLKEGDVGFFQMIKKDKFSFTKLQEAPPPPSPPPKKRTSTTARNPFFEVEINFKSYKNETLNVPMVFAKEHFSQLCKA